MIMKKITYILCAVATAMFISCEKPEDSSNPEPMPPVTETPDEPGKTEQPETEQPERPAEPSVNSYIVEGKEHKFGSVAVSNLGEYLCIAACTADGISSFEAMFEQEEYLYLAISPLLNGEEFDLKSESRLYTIISTLPGATIEGVAPEMNEEIESGECTFAYADGVTVAEIKVVLADGSALSAKLSAEEVIQVNENIIAVNNDTKPARTSFHGTEDGITSLYITPAGLSYASELEIATYYAYIILDDSLCNGKTIMASEIIEAGIINNVDETNLSSSETETTGTVNVLRDPENPAHYTVVAHLDFDGTVLDIKYDGYAIDVALEPEVIYEVKFDKQSYKIHEVTLDKTIGNDLWRVIIESEGEDLTITMPSTAFDGNPKGFSQFQKNPDVKVTYGENVYNKSTGSSGTITVGINGDVIHVEFTNYSDLEVLYEGNFKTIE